MKRTSFAIYDADGVRLWYSWDNYWNEQTQSFVIKDYDFDLTRGTYYICFSKSYGYTGRYTFNLKFTSAEESFDEGGNGTNNLLQNANAITLGKTYKGQIALNDEQDFYRFTLPSSGRVTLNGTSYMRRTSLAIYDAD